MSAIAEQFFTNLGGLTQLPDPLQMNFSSAFPQTGTPNQTAHIRLTLILPTEQYAVIYNNPNYEVPQGVQDFEISIPTAGLFVNDVADGSAVPIFDFVTAETPYVLVLQVWEDGGPAMSSEIGDIQSGTVDMTGDALFAFSKLRESAGFEVVPPVRNLGVISRLDELQFDLLKHGNVQPYIIADAYINLPGGNHIKFPQLAIEVADGPITTFPVNIAWQPVFSDSGAPMGELWSWLGGGDMYSVVVRFRQSATMETVNNATDGWIQPGHIGMDNQSGAVAFIKDNASDNQIFRAIITNIGQEKIAQQIALGQKVILKQAAIDDGNGQPYDPSPAQTSLVNEVWRGDIAAGEVEIEGNVIRTLIVLGANVGNFWCRAVGLFDEDGDLIAVASIPATQKVASHSGVDFKKRILVNIIVTDASAIEIVVNPVLNTVDHEQMQEALIELTAKLQADFDAHNADPAAHGPAIGAHNSASNAHGNHFTNANNPHNVTFPQLVPGGVLPPNMGGSGQASPNIAQFTSDGGSVYGWGFRFGPMIMYWGFAWFIGRNGGGRVVSFPHALQRDYYTTFVQEINLRNTNGQMGPPGGTTGNGTAGGATLTTRNRNATGFAIRNNSSSEVITANWFVVGLAA